MYTLSTAMYAVSKELHSEYEIRVRKELPTLCLDVSLPLRLSLPHHLSIGSMYLVDHLFRIGPMPNEVGRLSAKEGQ